MNGFIYRKGGVILTGLLLFNCLCGTSYAYEDACDALLIEEESLIASDELVFDKTASSYDLNDDLISSDEFLSDDTFTFEDSDELLEEEEFFEDSLSDSDNSNSLADTDPDDSFTDEDPEALEYFTVTYATDEFGVSNLPVDSTIYKKGDFVTVTNLEPVRRGYTFWGWSMTGDASCVYSAGYSFEITEDVIFYATWSEDEYIFEDEYNTYVTDNTNNKVVRAINEYVASLKGRFNPYYYYGKTLKSIQCCAFTDQIWQNVFGISRYSKEKKYTIIDSRTKLGRSDIYKFLKDNNAQPGDIIWCHDPVSAKKYNITHFMILMGYDEKGITITDGYERNGKGIIWKNNQRVSYTGDHAKYFSGNCYIRIYHVNQNN
jgi:uncharacterized repeat protein (TIGR02543 family)